MFTKFFNRQRPALLLAVSVGTVFAAGASAQTDTALVPFLVNVDAVVRADLPGVAVGGAPTAQISVTADVEAVLRIPLQKTDGVRFFGTQRQAGIPAIIGNRSGKVILSLSAQSYGSAEISLYTVSGKRIFRNKISASGSVSRRNAAKGIYLLSVKGTGGNVIASRMTHGGGSLDISVDFGDKSFSAAQGLAKKAEVRDYTITVTPKDVGYIGASYQFNPVAGANNDVQYITLREAPAGTYAVTVSSVGFGASGSGGYAPGATVNITAGMAPAGFRFQTWASESNGVIFAGATNASTMFIMPPNAVVVTAVFEAVAVYAVTVSSAGVGTAGNGSYREGDAVAISAGAAPEGQRFKNWATESGGVAFADANSASTSFTMPANAVTVTAVFQTNTYTVTVLSVGAGATGSGEYSPGVMVSITAGTHPDGVPFRRWTVSSGNVFFADVNGGITSFIMPAEEVTVTAVFKAAFTDDRDGKIYEMVKIGTQTWMAENLNYQPASGNSWCDSYSCSKYGRLYDWETAKTVCPTRWHLPSPADWDTLIAAVGGAGVAGKMLKAASGWQVYGGKSGNGTDDYGFSALPSGSKREFAVGYHGVWWTATESDYRHMSYNDYMDGGYRNDDLFPVRCLKDN